MRDQYECFSCGSCEFLQELPQTVPSDRSWMYRPADGDFPGDINRAPSEAGTSSSQRRRQRRRQRGKGNPPWHPSDAAEWAESEAMTHDPSIDPDAPLHVPPVQIPHEEHGNRSLAGNSAGAARAHPSAAGSGRSNSVTSKPSEDRLLSALRRLVSDRKDDDEWDPAKGPSKGIRWRGGTPPQAPTWSYDKEDLRAYNKYVRKVEIWLLQVAPYMTRKEAALQLYGALAGEPEAELEHCPITDIYQDDGVERILEALKAPMEAEAGVPEAQVLA